MRPPTMKQLLITNTDFSKRLLLVFVLISSSILLHGIAYSKTISAELLQNKGSSLTIKIHVPSPPPASIIVQFTLPSGTTIQKSSPNVSKFDSKSNTAKWLLRNIATGTKTISVVTSKRIKTKDAAAIIRYRDRSSGSLVEVRANSN